MKKITAKEAYRLMDQLGLDYGDDGVTYYATDADEVGEEDAEVWEFDSKKERDDFVQRAWNEAGLALAEHNSFNF